MPIRVTNQIERLKQMEDHRLIDGVKNYRQYGYSKELRGEILSVLVERGISEEELRLGGIFDNITYDRALDIYTSYRRNSLIAFCLFPLILLVNIAAPSLSDQPDFSLTLFLALFFVQFGLIGIHLVCIIQSFMDQNQFYRSIGRSETDGSVLYLFLGMPVYIFMYMDFRKQMKEQMSMIR